LRHWHPADEKGGGPATESGPLEFFLLRVAAIRGKEDFR
jgi:hypothetical protein